MITFPKQTMTRLQVGCVLQGLIKIPEKCAAMSRGRGKNASWHVPAFHLLRLPVDNDVLSRVVPVYGEVLEGDRMQEESPLGK